METGGIKTPLPQIQNKNTTTDANTVITASFLITAVITVYTKPAAKLGYFVPDTHNLID